MKAVVYGAGTMGAEVAAAVSARGYRLVGLLDDKAGLAGDRVVAGLPVQTCERWLAENSAADTVAFVALHNPFASVAVTEKRLRSLGFCDTVSPVRLYRQWPDALAPKYWLAPTSSIDEDDVGRARARLADDRSRALFDATLRLRASGDYGAMPAPAPEEQYIPADLPPLPRELAFIDCGAFVGDTLQSITAAGHELTELLAFEPDLDNYRRLVASWRHLPRAVFAPCGVAGRAERASFSTGGGASSGLSTSGGDMCQCVALDEFAPEFPANFIKMDIEGAEPAALDGARRLIERRRPRLAVSAYHAPEHLWSLINQVASWDLGYRFHLRSHAYNGFDTVMYALP